MRRGHARVEMGARARWLPHLVGRASDPCPPILGDGNTGGASPNAGNGRPDFVDERNRDLRIALRGDARLRAMARHDHAERERYPAIVWHAHGVRGELLNQRESCAEDLCRRFGRKGELAAWRAGHADRRALTDALARIAFGNVLLYVAERAYEHDEWDVVIPVPARTKFVEALASEWEKVRSRILERTNAPPPVDCHDKP